MSFIESFNRIVSEVERLIEFDDYNGYLKAEEIIKILSKQEGKTVRDLDQDFKNIAEISINKYVKRRKMMATYEEMLKDESFDSESYIECSGYDNVSSFSIGFSKMFGMSPSEAFQMKDSSKLEGPISINSIISDAFSSVYPYDFSEKIFGLPKEIIERYNEIREFQALYGLEDLFAELAVSLNEENGIDLENAFKTIDNFVMDYMFDYPFEKSSLQKIQKYIKEEVPAVYIKHLYPDVDLLELNNWCLHMKDAGGNAVEESPEFVRVFIDNISDGISYNELKELYNIYLTEDVDADSFWEFIGSVQAYLEMESREDDRDYIDYTYYREREEAEWGLGYDKEDFEDM